MSADLYFAVFSTVVKMLSAMSFACSCAFGFQGDLAEVVHASEKTELTFWSAGVAKQSAQ